MSAFATLFPYGLKWNCEWNWDWNNKFSESVASDWGFMMLQTLNKHNLLQKIVPNFLSTLSTQSHCNELWSSLNHILVLGGKTSVVSMSLFCYILNPLRIESVTFHGVRSSIRMRIYQPIQLFFTWVAYAKS